MCCSICTWCMRIAKTGAVWARSSSISPTGIFFVVFDWCHIHRLSASARTVCAGSLLAALAIPYRHSVDASTMPQNMQKLIIGSRHALHLVLTLVFVCKQLAIAHNFFFALFLFHPTTEWTKSFDKRRKKQATYTMWVEKMKKKISNKTVVTGQIVCIFAYGIPIADLKCASARSAASAHDSGMWEYNLSTKSSLALSGARARLRSPKHTIMLILCASAIIGGKLNCRDWFMTLFHFSTFLERLKNSIAGPNTQAERELRLQAHTLDVCSSSIFMMILLLPSFLPRRRRRRLHNYLFVFVSWPPLLSLFLPHSLVLALQPHLAPFLTLSLRAFLFISHRTLYSSPDYCYNYVIPI